MPPVNQISKILQIYYFFFASGKTQTKENTNQ